MHKMPHTVIHTKDGSCTRRCKSRLNHYERIAGGRYPPT